MFWRLIHVSARISNLSPRNAEQDFITWTHDSYLLVSSRTLGLFPFSVIIKKKGYKHSHTGFGVDVHPHFSWVNTQGQGGWVVRLSVMFDCMRNCTTVFKSGRNHFLFLQQRMGLPVLCILGGIRFIHFLSVCFSLLTGCVVEPYCGLNVHFSND